MYIKTRVEGADVHVRCADPSGRLCYYCMSEKHTTIKGTPDDTLLVLRDSARLTVAVLAWIRSSQCLSGAERRRCVWNRIGHDLALEHNGMCSY